MKIRQNNQILLEQKEKLIANKRKNLKKSINTKNILNILNDYNYPDLKNILSVNIDEFSESLVNDVLLNQNQNQQAPDEKQLGIEVIGAIMKMIQQSKTIRSVEDTKKTKENEKNILNKEKQASDKYKDFDDCIDRIDGETKIRNVDGRFGTERYKIALINDSCDAKLRGKNKSIAGYNEVFNYDGIDPCEIVITKIYIIADLSKKESENDLKSILI